MVKKDLVPPIIYNMCKRIKCDNYLYYFNEYNLWNDANKAARGYGKAYESINILDSVVDATQKVRKGEALYEQDGVAYYKEDFIYELLASLFYILSNERQLLVCDWGGALGSTYFRYRSKFPLECLSWSVIEQIHYVEYGKINIPEISFFYNIEECMEKNKNLNCILLSSVLPYLENPYQILEALLSKRIKYVLIDETVFNIENEDEKIVLQHVPDSIYKAVYPSHIFNRDKMVNYIKKFGYQKIFEWVYPRGSIPIKTRFGFKKTINRGFLFKLE